MTWGILGRDRYRTHNLTSSAPPLTGGNSEKQTRVTVFPRVSFMVEEKMSQRWSCDDRDGTTDPSDTLCDRDRDTRLSGRQSAREVGGPRVPRSDSGPDKVGRYLPPFSFRPVTHKECPNQTRDSAPPTPRPWRRLTVSTRTEPVGVGGVGRSGGT